MLAHVQAQLDLLAEDAAADLERQGVPRAAQHVTRHVHLKYAGTDTALIVAWGALSQMRTAFAEAYRQRFSFLMPEKPLIVESVSVEVTGGGDTLLEHPISGTPAASGQLPTAAATVPMFSARRWHETPLYRRTDMVPGHVVPGPAIIAEANATTVVEPGWEATVTALGHLVLTRVVARPQRRAIGTSADPVMLEVFNNLFMSIAEQMGVRLQNTAYSVNIKERLDFSCALFDAAGNLIANAPHIPVHLGSMSESVKSVMRDNAGTMQPGDAYVVNDPYHGGTHLPDITVITPTRLHAAQFDYGG
jgi:5-oxoprolinase (ATP-hydrolysing)